MEIMPKISLITPTRNRPNDLKTFLESIKNTTKNPDDIEILFYVDDDDHVTIPMIKKLEALYSAYSVYFHIGPRSDHFSRDYYNFLAKMAKGRWILAINDDSVFETVGWDKEICEKMGEAAKKFGDDILFGIIDDGMFVKGSEADMRTFSCWPLLSKEYSDLMGGILIEEIYTWGGDFWLGRIFAKVQGGQRRVNIRGVLIEHNSHHSNPKKDPSQHIPQPESFAHFQRIESEHPCTFDGKGISQKLKKITDYLNNK